MNTKTETVTIMAIDTSCDDTSVAIIRNGKIASNVIASQTAIHQKFGGVFPTLAKSAHQENLPIISEQALKKAQINIDKINYLAITLGPGLAPALETGIKYINQLSNQYNLPIIGINHLEGHLWSVWARPENKNKQIHSQPISPPPSTIANHSDSLINTTQFLANIASLSNSTTQLAPYLASTKLPINNVDNTQTSAYKLPALAIIVSGGNSLFIWVQAFGQYQVLGQSLDDALGEALDKVGRMLNLGYPAGPVIEQLAKIGDHTRFSFPLPMTERNDFNLSFSGLKTKARQLIEQQPNILTSKTDLIDFASSFQYSCFKHLNYKLSKILQKYQPQSVWLSGGVASNLALRKSIRETLKVSLRSTHRINFASHLVTNVSSDRHLTTRLGTHLTCQQPSYGKSSNFNLKRKLIPLLIPYHHKLCADNAAMIGLVGWFKLMTGLIGNYYKLPEKNPLPIKKLAFIQQLERKPRWPIDQCLN